MNGAPLLLLPGIGGDGSAWGDMPGGQVLTSAAASVDAMADDILIRAPDRFALAGSSLGGYVALAIMRRAPERVTRLALISTSAMPDSETQKQLRAKMIAAAERDYERLIGAMLPGMVHPEALPALADGLTAMLRRAGSATFIRQQRAAAARPDARSALAAIGVPTLVLAGEDDQIIPPARSVELADAIPSARLVLLPRCGHIPALERPAETRAAMLDWLREGTAPSRA